MRDAVVITVYSGVDYESRAAERACREAQSILVREYGLPVEVINVPVPVPSEDAPSHGVPLVLVDGRPIAKGRAPLISDIVEAVFEVIGEEYGIQGPHLPEVAVGV